MKIILPSFSKLKYHALETTLQSVFSTPIQIIQMKTTTICEQPLGVKNTIDICKNRIKQILESNDPSLLKEHQYIISIENGINLDSEIPMDFVVVGLYSMKLKRFYIESGGQNIKNISNCLISDMYNAPIKEFLDLIPKINSNNTFGSLIHRRNRKIPANNWMNSLCGLDRRDQISGILCRHIPTIQLIEGFKTYMDFPRKGIVFNDIIGLMSKPKYSKIVLNKIHKALKNSDVKFEYVVGLDARGFILGGMLANKLDIGFIPIRKKGKLPGDCFQAVYEKEYGEDVFEIQKEAISEKKTVNVIVIDDILATGGTAKAAIKLLRNLPQVAEIFLVFLDKIDGFTVDLEGNNHYTVLEDSVCID